MTVATHDRPPAPRTPLRHPDASSATLMTRRGWWLVVLNILIPGSAQTLAGSRRLGRIGLASTLALWAGAVLTVAAGMLCRPALLAALTTPAVLLLIEVVAVGYLAVWTVLTLDTLRLVRLVRVHGRARVALTAVSVGVLVAAGCTGVHGVRAADAARGALGTVFGASGPAVPPTDGYYNILLLGGDGGRGRDSLRFDSISVVSVDAATGHVVLTGVPRDLAGFPFAPGSPMTALYPRLHTGHADPVCGWTAAINQLNTELQVCRDGARIYPDAVRNGSTPGIEATKDAVEGLTGIPIAFYAFLDMAGFAALVDALGGVTVTVTQRLPEGGGPRRPGEPASSWATGWIEPGTQHMDGDTAQWYARSRKTTSDWDRMRRQRQLQQAILAEFTPATVLSRFDRIAAAGRHLVKTDVPAAMLGRLADLAVKARRQQVTTLELTPARGVDQTHPDPAAVRRLVHRTLHPSAGPSPHPSAPAARG